MSETPDHMIPGDGHPNEPDESLYRWTVLIAGPPRQLGSSTGYPAIVAAGIVPISACRILVQFIVATTVNVQAEATRSFFQRLNQD